MGFAGCQVCDGVCGGCGAKGWWDERGVEAKGGLISLAQTLGAHPITSRSSKQSKGPLGDVYVRSDGSVWNRMSPYNGIERVEIKHQQKKNRTQFKKGMKS